MTFEKIQSNLYKYTSVKSALMILKTQEIKITNPNEFNDPFDCNIPNFEMAKKPLINEIKRQLKNAIPELKNNKHSKEALLFDLKIGHEMNYFQELTNKEFTKIANEWENIIGNFRILSLAKSEKNILMWSHYADFHKGVCVGFKEDSFIAKQCRKVDYGDGSTVMNNFINHLVYFLVKNIDIFSKNSHFADVFSSKAADITLRVFIEYLYIKRKEWDYEQEFRLVLSKLSDIIRHTEEMSFIEFNKGDVAEVILGSKMEESKFEELFGFIKQNYPDILVKKAIKQGWDLRFIELKI